MPKLLWLSFQPYKPNNGTGRQQNSWLDKDLPYLEAKDAWFRQCNFLSSLDLLNFNLLDTQPVEKDQTGPINGVYKRFNASQFDEDFQEDRDGFLGIFLSLVFSDHRKSTIIKNAR